MSNIFRQCPSGRISGDDLIRNVNIANEFFEAGEQHSGYASISGKGTLAGAIQKGGQGSATVSALGHLAALGFAAMFGLAVISGGPGHQIVVGTKAAISSGLISGNGSLIATGEKFEGEPHFGVAAISGNGVLLSEGKKTALNSISISDNGSLAAVGGKSTSSLAAISVGGHLIGAGSKQTVGDGIISGGGSLVVTGEKVPAYEGTSALSGGGEIVGIGLKASAGAITITGDKSEIPIVMTMGGKLMKKISDTFYLEL